jgi:hypothetical protein
LNSSTARWLVEGNDTQLDYFFDESIRPREHLAELWPEWSPKKREDVAAILRQLAQEIIPETKAV